MEDWLQNQLAKLNKYFTVEDGRVQAEFASHMLLGLWVVSVGYMIGTLGGMVAALAFLVLYSVYKELIDDGHLKRRLDGTESDYKKKDMWTDLFSRMVPAALFTGIVALICLL